MTEDRPARRIVVTGLGVHCGLGDLASCKEALASGRSAVRAGAPPGAPGFPPSAIAPADLAPIRDAPADRKLHKYMSPATVLAVIAAGRALDDAGLLDDPAGRGNMALYMATGPIAFDFSTVGRSLASAAGETGRVDLRFVGEHGLRLIHPLMPFKMLLNMPLGLVSIVYGLRGDNVIAYPGAMQAAAVLEAAVRHIARGRFERALVGGAEQGVAAMPLALLARRGRLAGSPELVRPFEERHAGLAAADLAAFLVLESEESAAARGARALAEVSAPRPGAPASSERRRAPDRVLVTGSVDRGSDESVVRATDDVWPAVRPVLVSLDGLAGYAASASLFAHLALGARAIDGAEAALETPRVHVVSLDPEGRGSAWVRLGPPGQGTDAHAHAHAHAHGLAVFSSTSTDRGARPRAGERRRVVVTGMGVVSPIGVGRTAFFEGLATARSGIDAIRSFDAATFPTRVAGEVRGLDVASVRLPDELAAALRADPKSVFGIVAAREALADAFGGASVIPCAPDRRAVFIAAGLEILRLDDLARCLRGGDIDPRVLHDEVLRAPLDSRVQVPADVGARVIAAEVGAAGVVMIDVSACAAGTQALGEAFRAVSDGVCDVAIAGGYDSMINPLGVGGFCMLEALSRSNDRGPTASRPFDSTRDGFVLGEGAAVLVLEERTAALRRGARVHAEVLGYGSSLDAYRVSDPAPDQAGAVRVLRAALDDAGLEPADIDYVNAHGTGTRQNDPAEARAIRVVFGPEADRVPVSSTKSQIGHLIGAAGAVELCAGLFALRRQVLPATITLRSPDPECDLCHVAPEPRAARVRSFLSTSFGFGGQNAAIVACRADEPFGPPP